MRGASAFLLPERLVGTALRRSGASPAAAAPESTLRFFIFPGEVLMSAKRRSLKATDGLRATASSGMVIGMIGGEEDRNVLLTSRKRLL